ncbi:MAG: cysteine desulfurase [Spirochaetes bacterium]|nr:MAG: cysteine desulfurase [Spirochaetota bacterium]
MHVMELIYLDWAATTPISRNVLEEMNRVFLEYPGNPSSLHKEGKKAADLLAQDRIKAAALLGTDPRHVYFTGGGTESNAIILNSLLTKESRGSVLISGIEHPAVFEYTKTLRKNGYTVSVLHPDKRGIITAENVRSRLTEDTFLVAVMTLNNETGIIQPVKKIAEEIRSFEKNNRRPIHFHTDGVQALGKIPLDLSEFGVDSAAFSGHKIQGPRGTGILFAKKPPEPLSKAGGQEFGVRGGTENLSGIHGLVTAMEETIGTMSERTAHAEKLRSLLIEKLEDIPEMKLNFDIQNQSPFIISVNEKTFPSEVFARIMSDRGFAVSPGSACSSKNKTKMNRVLTSCGLSSDEAFHSFRISTGFSTAEEDIISFCRTAKNELSKLRRR